MNEKIEPHYRGIIFDLDGVLCYTDKYHYQAWKQMTEKWHIPFDESINNRLRGVSRRDSLEIILENWHGQPFSEEEKQTMLKEKNQTYCSLISQMTEADANPQTVEVLTFLRNNGIKTAVGSSSKNAQLILDRLNYRPYFDDIVDGTMIRHSKPDPEVFLKAAEGLKLLPAECLVVEDSRAGIDAAVNGGFHTCGIGDASSYYLSEWKIKQLIELENIVV
jgi:beta-phosphoglucomutase